MRTYGKMSMAGEHWVIEEIEAHVAIKLKNVFSRIPKHKAVPFTIDATDEMAVDLKWFMSRYPFQMTPYASDDLTKKALRYNALQRNLDIIMASDYVPRKFKFNGEARDYQARGAELHLQVKRLLNGDVVGLGKTVEALLSLTDERTLPALVVVQAHLPIQWCEQITRFLSMKTHVIKGTRPYVLPHADVYVTTYSRLAGWVDVFQKAPFKSIIFDEVQELRRQESAKYEAAKVLQTGAEFVVGLSATPVYNYGDEIFNIMNVIKPGALGAAEDFYREWCTTDHQVKDPKALGAYLREQHLFIRRTRTEVGRELPPVNTIIHTVGHDEEAVKKVEEIAHKLATTVTTGSFVQRGEAARELDMLMRMITGVSKAKYVAEYVKILLDNGEPVLLAGWHRDVYDIWLKELKDYNPVMYTGSESASQKEQAKHDFISGKSNLMIISLRSGIGLDGLQERCSYVVLGELDWSPKVHEQLIGRIRRDGMKVVEGNPLLGVSAIYLVSDGGSDPLLIDTLGIKASQAAGITDPFHGAQEVHSDDSRIKNLARYILARTKGKSDGDGTAEYVKGSQREES